MSDTLFELEVAPVESDVDDTGDELLDLRPGGDAWASCRHCQLLTTEAGIGNRGHGAGSATCARYLAMYGGAV